MIARRTSEIFAASIASSRAPAAAFGIVTNGSLVDAEFIGGVSSLTRFRIASMTKSFTAALTLLLRDEGVLNLDVPVAILAPELRPIDDAVQRAWPDAVPVTLRHMLTMSSGLANDDPWADRHLDATAAEFKAFLSGGLVSVFAPGTGFEYSNVGYASIGLVIERVTGKTVQALIAERILGPLAMTATGWDLRADTDDWARPHRLDDDAVSVEPHLPGDGVIAPMGGLWTTLDDLTRWVAHLCDPASPGPIGSEARREMQASHTPIPPSDVLPIGGGYGMGLNRLGDRAVGPIVEHSGGLPGYGSNMQWLADGSTALIGMANVTYARMFRMNRTILRNLVQSAPSGPRHPMTELGERFVALVNDWTDGGASALFSDNMALDDSFARRAAASAKLVGEHGPLELVAVDPAHPAAATLTILGTTSNRLLACDVSRSPHARPMIQYYRFG